MKYVAINIVHYSKIDDFGEKAAGKNPPKRSDLLRTCIGSIVKNTNYPAELQVWDNGGDTDDTDYLVQKVRDGEINQLVRSKNNMHFALSWNKLAKISDAPYFAFICNDVELLPNWLNECMRILKEHDDKIISTPLITYDKRRYTTTLENGDRKNPRSGSNCLVISRELFYEIGEWPVHRIGGTIWYNKIYKMGIPTIAPPDDLAIDRGWRHGVDFSVHIKVEKRLLNGESIDFTSKLQV